MAQLKGILSETTRFCRKDGTWRELKQGTEVDILDGYSPDEGHVIMVCRLVSDWSGDEFFAEIPNDKLTIRLEVM